MAIQTQLRRGTTAENDAFTGAIGELVYDTQAKQLRMQDGITLGGIKVPIVGDFESTGITDDATATVLTLTALNNAEFSGNIGIGVALEAWSSSASVLQLGGNASLWAHTTAGAGKTFNIFQNAWHDGVDFKYQDTDEASRIQFTGGQHIFSVAPSGTADSAITWTTALTINNTGNATFGGDVSLADSKHLYLGNSNDLDIYHDVVDNRIYSNMGTLFIRNTVTSALCRFQAKNSGGTNKECIAYGGATPDVKLYYDGLQRLVTQSSGIELTGADNNNVLSIVNSHGSTPLGMNIAFNAAAPNNTTQYFYRGADNAAARVYIYSNGDLQNANNSYGAISDVKFKQDISKSESQWDDIKAIGKIVSRYRMKTDVVQDAGAPYMIGLVAQELELISPALVTDNQVGTDEEYKSVKYSILYMKSVKALGEALERIEALENINN